MSKISNKRKILAVGLLSIVGLAACSSNVQAKPSDYDENLLTFLDNDQIYQTLFLSSKTLTMMALKAIMS